MYEEWIADRVFHFTISAEAWGIFRRSALLNPFPDADHTTFIERRLKTVFSLSIGHFLYKLNFSRHCRLFMAVCLSRRLCLPLLGRRQTRPMLSRMTMTLPGGNFAVISGPSPPDSINAPRCSSTGHKHPPHSASEAMREAYAGYSIQIHAMDGAYGVQCTRCSTLNYHFRLSMSASPAVQSIPAITL